MAASLPRPIAYVLAGGASFGAVQVGQLRALAKTDIEPDFVVGTSVGALNGTVVAEAPDVAADRLAALWSTVTREDVFGRNIPTAMRVAARQSAAVDNASLRAFIERSVQARDFGELAVPHTAVTTDFDTGEVIPLNSGDLVSAVLASAAIPGVFPIIERDGRRLVDGGVVENVPIGIAAAQGAQTIVILDCGFTVLAPRAASDGKQPSMMANLLRMAAIMAAQQVKRELAEVTGTGRTVLYLPGPWPMKTRPDDFRHSSQLAEAAYGLALAWLSELDISGPGRYGTAPSDSVSASV